MVATAKKSTSFARNQTKSSDSISVKTNHVKNTPIKNRLRNGENRAPLPSLPRKVGSVSLYDSNGIFRTTQEDICDCFNKKCPGCHFPCEKCKSEKCGPTCRVFRRYIFEQIEYDGKAEVKINPKYI